MRITQSTGSKERRAELQECALASFRSSSSRTVSKSLMDITTTTTNNNNNNTITTINTSNNNKHKQ
eukprot:11192589-Lingulodinium_polyedra.AAC.1